MHLIFFIYWNHYRLLIKNTAKVMEISTVKN